MLCLSAISPFGPTSGVVINLFALDACRLNWPPLLDSVFCKAARAFGVCLSRGVSPGQSLPIDDRFSDRRALPRPPRLAWRPRLWEWPWAPIAPTRCQHKVPARPPRPRSEARSALLRWRCSGDWSKRSCCRQPSFDSNTHAHDGRAGVLVGRAVNRKPKCILAAEIRLWSINHAGAPPRSDRAMLWVDGDR
jgi:hypothetical protein